MQIQKKTRENKPTSSSQKTIDDTFTSRDNVLFAEIRFALQLNLIIHSIPVKI